MRAISFERSNKYLGFIFAFLLGSGRVPLFFTGSEPNPTKAAFYWYSSLEGIYYLENEMPFILLDKKYIRNETSFISFIFAQNFSLKKQRKNIKSLWALQNRNPVCDITENRDQFTHGLFAN